MCGKNVQVDKYYTTLFVSATKIQRKVSFTYIYHDSSTYLITFLYEVPSTGDYFYLNKINNLFD